MIPASAQVLIRTADSHNNAHVIDTNYTNPCGNQSNGLPIPDTAITCSPVAYGAIMTLCRIVCPPSAMGTGDTHPVHATHLTCHASHVTTTCHSANVNTPLPTARSYISHAMYLMSQPHVTLLMSTLPCQQTALTASTHHTWNERTHLSISCRNTSSRTHMHAPHAHVCANTHHEVHKHIHKQHSSHIPHPHSTGVMCSRHLPLAISPNSDSLITSYCGQVLWQLQRAVNRSEQSVQ